MRPPPFRLTLAGALLLAACGPPDAGPGAGEDTAVADTASDRWDDAAARLDEAVSALGAIADEAAARWDDAVAAVRRATGRQKWYERVPTWGWVAGGGTLVVAGVVVYRRRRAAKEEEAERTASLERTPDDPPVGADPGVAAATAAPTSAETTTRADETGAAS